MEKYGNENITKGFLEKIQKTICILIYEGKMDETKELKEYHTKWKLLEEKHPDKVFSDDIEIHVIELSKFKEGGEARPEDNWIRLLKSKGTDGMKKISEEVEKEIQEALKELDMYKKGMSIDDICKFTDVPKEEIDVILKK